MGVDRALLALPERGARVGLPADILLSLDARRPGAPGPCAQDGGAAGGARLRRVVLRGDRGRPRGECHERAARAPAGAIVHAPLDAAERALNLARTAEASHVANTPAQVGFARLLFGYEALAEIRRLVVRTNLEIRFLAGHRVRALLRPLDRLFDRLHFPDPEARDKLLGLGERAVNDGPLRAVEANALAVLAGFQAVAALHDARLDELFVIPAHLGEHLRHLLGFLE